MNMTDLETAICPSHQPVCEKSEPFMRSGIQRLKSLTHSWCHPSIQRMPRLKSHRPRGYFPAEVPEYADRTRHVAG